MTKNFYAITNPARMTHFADSPDVCAFQTAEWRDQFVAESHGCFIVMTDQPFGFDLDEIIDDYGTDGQEPMFYHWHMTTEPCVNVACDYDDLLDIIKYDTFVD